MLASIAASDVDSEWAEAYLKAIDGTVPWASRVEFMRAINAYKTVYRYECEKHSGRFPIMMKIVHSATPDGCEWMFNFTRYCASLPLLEYQQLPSGTSSNEALHREMNQEVVPRIRRYESTMQLTLRGFLLGKVLSHDHSTHTAFTTQHRQEDILGRLVQSLHLFTDDQWAALCTARNSLHSAEDRHEGHRLRNEQLPLFCRGNLLAKRVQSWTVSKLALKMNKRFTGKTRLRRVRGPTSLKGKKRTPFTALAGRKKLYGHGCGGPGS